MYHTENKMAYCYGKLYDGSSNILKQNFYDPGIPPLGNYVKEPKVDSWNNMYIHIHSRIIK